MKPIISNKAKIGTRVTIGPYTVIHDDVVIGDDCSIGSHCVIGEPTDLANGRDLVIGQNSIIRSHCVLYQGSDFGSQLETGHHVTIREHTTAGINLRVGTMGDIQGDCQFGDCVRLHSNVHIAKTTSVGDFVWMFPGATSTNDPFPPSETRESVSVCDLAIVCSGALLLPGVQIGRGAFVAANSTVGKNVADVECVRGNPADHFAWLHQFVDFSHGLRHPWPDRYRPIPDECNGKLDKVTAVVRVLMDEKANTAS